MPTIIPIGMTINEPKKRRTYTREDYERMVTWASKKVKFDDTEAEIRKFQRTLDEYLTRLNAEKMDKNVEKVIKERDKFEKTVKRKFRKDILEDVYNSAVERFGRDVARRIREGWRTAMTLDSYELFSDLFNAVVMIPSDEELIERALRNRVPDYEYTTKKGHVVRVYLWSKLEENLLKDMYKQGKPVKEIQRLMPYRTLSSIRNKIYRLKKKGEL